MRSKENFVLEEMFRVVLKLESVSDLVSLTCDPVGNLRWLKLSCMRELLRGLTSKYVGVSLA